MRKEKKYNPVFFPFSPGIPWPVHRGKYIKPEIDTDLYKDIIKDKNIIVTAFGGPLESFFSLSYIEMLAKVFLFNKNISWKGFSRFNLFSYSQGLSNISNIDLNRNVLTKYPVPLFFDAKDNVYYNCLNNYIESRSYWRLYPIKNKEPLLKQIFNNSMVLWNDFVPNMRQVPNSKFSTWKRINNFNERKKTILIFPNKTETLHNYSGLQWNEHNIRELSALMHGSGFQIAVCSDRVFHGSNIKTFKYDLEIILNLMKFSYMVLSETIDWHLINIMCSPKCISVSTRDTNFDLFKEIEFLGKSNVISIEEGFLYPKLVKSIAELHL